MATYPVWGPLLFQKKSVSRSTFSIIILKDVGQRKPVYIFNMWCPGVQVSYEQPGAIEVETVVLPSISTYDSDRMSGICNVAQKGG